MCIGVLVIAAAVVGCADTTTVRITILGSGAGSVTIHDPRSPGLGSTCTESCELTFSSGFLRLAVVSAFDKRGTAVEISGDVQDNGELGPLEGDDLDVTATFTSWKEAPVAFATIGVFAPDDDLIVGTAYGVSKVSLAGDVAWSTKLIPETSEIARIDMVDVTSSGDVFVVHLGTLTKLSASGGMDWSIQLPPEVAGDIAVTPGGDLVVVEESRRVRLMRGGDGSEAWSTPMSGARSVTVAPSGVIYVARTVALPPTGEIVRITAAGAPQTPRWSIPVDAGMRPGLAIDQEGALLVTSNDLLRFDPTTGAVLSMRRLTDPEPDTGSARRSPGSAVTSSNQAFVWIQGVMQAKHGGRIAAGAYVQTIDSSGMQTWPGEVILPEAGSVTSGTCDRNKHCVAFGFPGVRIYDVP